VFDSVALAIKDYPVIFITVIPHPNPSMSLGREVNFLVYPQDIEEIKGG
jgi:hypothetical protein